jgi:hypothetical protein
MRAAERAVRSPQTGLTANGLHLRLRRPHAGVEEATMKLNPRSLTATIAWAAAIVALTVASAPAAPGDGFCLGHSGVPECVEADLTVISTAASGDPLGVVGQTVTIHVDAVVANLGPDGPVDADVTQSASGSSGAIVTLASRTFHDGLVVGSLRTMSADYDVRCATPGAHTVVVTTSAVPEGAKVADLNVGNNARSVTFAIDCAVPVTVNVMPGSLTNPVTVHSDALPVADHAHNPTWALHMPDLGGPGAS